MPVGINHLSFMSLFSFDFIPFGHCIPSVFTGSLSAYSTKSLGCDVIIIAQLTQTPSWRNTTQIKVPCSEHISDHGCFLICTVQQVCFRFAESGGKPQRSAVPFTQVCCIISYLIPSSSSAVMILWQ